jgi:hypothetical protein
MAGHGRQGSMKRSTGIVPGYIGPALPGIKFISEPDICVRHPLGCDFNINNQARIVLGSSLDGL